MQRQGSQRISRIWWTVSVIQETYTVKQDTCGLSLSVLSTATLRRILPLHSGTETQL
jgi:hypothetical protein